MGDYGNLKEAIASVVKTNGNQEITGQLLQDVLVSMVNNLGAGASFMGVAKPDTAPGTPDGNVFYLAGRAGTYANFGGATLKNELAVFSNKSGSWTKETVLDLSSFNPDFGDVEDEIAGLQADVTGLQTEVAGLSEKMAALAAAQLERLTVRFDGTVADATILQNSALEPKRVLWVESKKRFAASAESVPSATPELYDNWLGLAGSAVPYGRDEYMDGGSVRADKAYLCGGDVYVCDPSTQALVKVGGSGGGDTSALETRVAALETADKERLPVPFHGTVATATVLLQSTQNPKRIYWVESERRFAADASDLETNPPGQLYSNWLATGGLPGADEFMSSVGIESVIREDKIFVSGAKCYLWDSESQTLVTPQGGGADKVVVIDISTLNVPNENKTNSFQDVDLGAGFDEIMNAVETGGPVMFKLNGGSVTPLTSFKVSDEMVTFVCLMALDAKTWAVTITSQEEGVSNVTIKVSDAKDLVGLNGTAKVEIVSELPGSPDEGTVYIIRGS